MLEQLVWQLGHQKHPIEIHSRPAHQLGRSPIGILLEPLSAILQVLVDRGCRLPVPAGMWVAPRGAIIAPVFWLSPPGVNHPRRSDRRAARGVFRYVVSKGRAHRGRLSSDFNGLPEARRGHAGERAQRSSMTGQAERGGRLAGRTRRRRAPVWNRSAASPWPL
jgi:hypothetical protein